MPSLRWALTLIAMSVAVSSAMAAKPEVSPSARSEAVRTLRPGPYEELRFSYSEDSKMGAPRVVQIGLARDYDYTSSNGSLTIHDYRLRGILTTLPGKRYVNNSLFGEVWFRGAELQNRVVLRKSLAASLGPQGLPVPFDAFWLETAVGLTHADLPRPKLTRQEEGSRSRWFLNGDEVASVYFAGNNVPEQLKAGLRRMWPSAIQLHPQIADDIAAMGRLPREMWIKTQAAGNGSTKPDFDVRHWTLTEIRTVSAAAYPLPPGLNAAPAESRGAFPEIFSILSTAVAERKLPQAEAVYVSRIEAALNRNAGVEALAWLTEMQLASGKPGAQCPPSDTGSYCRLLQKAAPTVRADPRLGLAFGNQPVTAAAYRAFDDLPNAYLIRLLFSTRPRTADVSFSDAESGLLAGIKASPIANFCKDAGDFYLQVWNFNAAWQAMDLGRLMAGHRDGDLLSSVDILEENLIRRLPTLF